MKQLIIILSIATGLVVIGAPVQAQVELELGEERFSDNWFDDLEKAQQNPAKVIYLDLSLQKLRAFPEEVFEFPNLTHLYLPYNYFNTIPDAIGQMKQLKVLDLSGTYYLNSLPESMGQLANLEKLIIKDNKLPAAEEAKIQKLLPNTDILLSDHTD